VGGSIEQYYRIEGIQMGIPMENRGENKGFQDDFAMGRRQQQQRKGVRVKRNMQTNPDSNRTAGHRFSPPLTWRLRRTGRPLPALPARVLDLRLWPRPLAFLGLDERGLLRRRGCWAAGSGASSRGGGVVIAFRFLLSISKEMARCYWDEEASGLAFLILKKEDKILLYSFLGHLAIHPDYGPI
jgi:hypothetical protein